LPTTSLVEQLYSDFQSYSQNNGWKASYNCYRIYGTVDKDSDMPIVISTWQSLYKLPKQYFQKFDVIYGDECHLFQAKSLTGIMNKCVNSAFRVGTTGTLDGSKVNKLVLEGLFGPVYRTTTTKELIDSNRLADLKIFAIVLHYSDQVKKDCKDLKYKEELDFLVQLNERNKFIRNLAIDQKGNTLVLFQLVEKQGKHLYDIISTKCEDRKVFFVYGGTDTQQREDIRKITEKETDAIIIGSYGCMSTGINIRNLHNIIFASPSKSRIRNLQSIGRGLRIGDNKDQCKLYDIGDDLTWKTRKNYTLYHMMERIKIYADEEFDYSFIRVPISA
jgi:superfamily II DNA or RNA helicase